jgi:hypothetical protein
MPDRIPAAFSTIGALISLTFAKISQAFDIGGNAAEVSQYVSIAAGLGALAASIVWIWTMIYDRTGERKPPKK